jgi:hypothetical protein
MFVMHMVKEHNQKERELLEIKKIFPTKPHPLHGAAVKSLKKDMNVNGPLKVYWRLTVISNFWSKMFSFSGQMELLIM